MNEHLKAQQQTDRITIIQEVDGQVAVYEIPFPQYVDMRLVERPRELDIHRYVYWDGRDEEPELHVKAVSGHNGITLYEGWDQAIAVMRRIEGEHHTFKRPRNADV